MILLMPAQVIHPFRIHHRTHSVSCPSPLSRKHAALSPRNVVEGEVRVEGEARFTSPLLEEGDEEGHDQLGAVVLLAQVPPGSLDLQEHACPC